MPKCFIFSIGGSGARILESFTNLIAAGCAYDQLKSWSFEPVIIDLDTSNGNTTSCIKTLQLYEKLYNDVCSSTGESPYFKFPISRSIGTGTDFLMQLTADANNTLSNTISYNALADFKDKGLVNLLYSDHVLQMPLKHGFKGVPSIGNVVLNQFKGNPIFESFTKQYQPGDRIVVIGSIFGGTGAAGIPLLLKNIRAMGGSLANAPIALLSVLPYFQIKSSENSMIDSDSFITKTKAALSYYNDNLTEPNDTYYVGYNDKAIYENHEGGTNQNNNPHAIEVLASTSIFHFLSKSDSDFKAFADKSTYIPSREFFICGFKNKGNIINFSTLEGDLAKWIKKPLTCFYYSALMGYFIGVSFVNAGRDVQVFNIKFSAGFQSSNFIKNFTEFQNNFMKWLHKLSNSNGELKFIPFETVEDLNQVESQFEDNKRLPLLIKDVTIPTKKGLLGFGTKTADSIRDSFSHFTKDVRGVGANDAHLFSEVSYQVPVTFIEEWNINLN